MRQASGRTASLTAWPAAPADADAKASTMTAELHLAVGAPCRVEKHRLAHEAGDELARPPFVELVGRACLGDDAVIHDDDAIAHRKQPRLVVRDVGDGEAEALLQGTDLLAHRAAQTRVEVRERLVEEQHGRLEDEGAGECDALLRGHAPAGAETSNVSSSPCLSTSSSSAARATLPGASSCPPCSRPFATASCQKAAASSPSRGRT